MSTPSTARIWIFWVVVLGTLFAFLFAIKAILLPFVVGIAIAYFLDPAADKLERIGCSRPFATTLITALFFVSIIALLMIVIPLISQQFTQFMQSLPATIVTLETQLEATFAMWTSTLAPSQMDSAKQAVTGISDELVALITDITKSILKSGFALINLLSLLVITPVVSFYLLRDWDRIKNKMNALLPRHHAPIIHEQLLNIDTAISGFVRGTLNVMFILGTYYAIALSIAGLNFAVLIGLFGGVIIIIPYLGTMLTAVFAIGMAYLQFDQTSDILVVVGIFIIGQMFEGYVLTPKLVGKKVGLHPLWLIFGMLAGASLFGFVGVFLAVPVTAVIGVLVRFAIERYLASDYYMESKATSSKHSS